MLEQACKAFDVDMKTPFEQLTKKEQDLVLKGSGERKFRFHYKNDFGNVRDTMIPFEGVMNNIKRRYEETSSDFTRNEMRKYMTELICPICKGKRLNREALSVKVQQKDIAEVSELSIKNGLSFFE